MAESIIGLYKTELIRMRGPWRSLDNVEYATLEWVDWFNHRRILEPIGNIPPVEREEAHYRQTGPTEARELTPPSLSVVFEHGACPLNFLGFLCTSGRPGIFARHRAACYKATYSGYGLANNVS
jgi:hypothetical protein